VRSSTLKRYNISLFIKSLAVYPKLSRKAIVEALRDLTCRLPDDPIPIEKAIDEGIAWLARAQDNTVSRDGGVARHFSLLSGWSTSYPETTGYIVPTLLEYARIKGDDNVFLRCRRMLDWLVKIQLSDGGFQGGLVDARPVMPVAFNTGQILMGLAAGVQAFGDEYRKPMQKAADWLVRNQDSDGCWRKHPSPFAMAGDKAYDTHIAWGLLEASRVDPSRGYAEAALANVRWSLTCQRDNGWFDKCCLAEPQRPLTHTLGYVLRGIVEAYRYFKNDELLAPCLRTANGLMSALRSNGFISGRLDPHFNASVSWACLTGSAQIAACWFILYELTGNAEFLSAARRVNEYLGHILKRNLLPEAKGALKGSFPVFGEYCAYQFPNWATKFLVDSFMLEKRILG
jgi:hypothetical protein